MIVSSCQHCDQNNFKLCALLDFLSNNIRFTHTSTVTRSNSCSGKNYAYALRAPCSRMLPDICHVNFIDIVAIL